MLDTKVTGVGKSSIRYGVRDVVHTLNGRGSIRFLDNNNFKRVGWANRLQSGYEALQVRPAIPGANQNGY